MGNQRDANTQTREHTNSILLFRTKRETGESTAVKAENEAMKSIALLNVIKKDSTNDNGLTNRSTNMLGIVDTCDYSKGVGMTLTATSEFALSLLTPLEKIEEKRSAVAGRLQNQKRVQNTHL